ncbi:LeuD/DmdB family oxidoreductase small subunit [Shumkonia mesophila]|uniref:LeuD/DmdB family oxidoreductase small subunit n=1 Tax=Shumkonia mesophila TaxID=2838854 RepID=UPI0029343F5F|nr:3-isopropylmalate dehydratase [Shumkonia mesophila]
MSEVLRGRVWKFGDNIDTDIIAPGDTISFGLGDADEERIVKENAFRDVRPEFYKRVERGDILVAGRNFGLGSHREPANKALRSLGFTAVVAESIARLFFRNSIAIGAHALRVPGITAMVEEGDKLEIDLDKWRIRNLTRGTEKQIEPYSELVQEILEGGGIVAVLKKRFESESRD